MKNIRKAIIKADGPPSMNGGTYRTTVTLVCGHTTSLSHSHYDFKLPKTTICGRCSVANDIRLAEENAVRQPSINKEIEPC